MKDIEKIAVQIVLDWRCTDNQTNELLSNMIQCGIKKAVAPIEHAFLETRVKAAALQRELDQFQQKLQCAESELNKLKEERAFDRAAREVWKAQLETATKFFQESIKMDQKKGFIATR